MTFVKSTFPPMTQTIDDLVRRAMQSSADARKALGDADELLNRRTELLLQQHELITELMAAGRGVCSAVSAFVSGTRDDD